MALVLALIGGLVAGVSAGLFGIAGGIIIVPWFVYVMKMSQHEAQGTSIFTLTFPVLVLGAVNYFKADHVDVPKAVLLAIGIVVATYVGSKFALGIDPATMRRAFGGMLVVVGLVMVFVK